MSRPIFVFGSNREGRHGKGAALEARRKHGAVQGQAEGIQGMSYGIVTKELRRNYPPVRLEEVRSGVLRFLAFAREHPELHFRVTAVGCGLAGFKRGQIWPMFEGRGANVEMLWSE